LTDGSLKDMLAGASVAFVGTVRSFGESPEPGIEADERTARVQVEQPLQAPDQVDLSPGSAVVVQLNPELPALEPGDRSAFFVEPLVYGDTLVADEVARSDSPEVLAGTAAPRDEPGTTHVAMARGELREEGVLGHAREADAVVRGVVVALRAAESKPHKEHDPNWWIATLDCDVVAHGEVVGVGPEGGEVEVLYANSIDRRFRRWPKPKAGQGGMWILHATEGELAQLAPFQLRHPEDLQPSLTLDELLGEAPEEEEDEDLDEDVDGPGEPTP
jgi:hypothetical protein